MVYARSFGVRRSFRYYYYTGIYGTTTAYTLTMNTNTARTMVLSFRSLVSTPAVAPMAVTAETIVLARLASELDALAARSAAKSAAARFALSVL